MRIVWPCVSFTSTPRASSLSAISRPVPCAGSMSTPAQSPATRTAVTPWPTSSAQLRLEVLAERRGAALELARRQHLDDAGADRGGQRVAAERRAVLARADHTEHVAVRDDRGHGQDAAAQRLAEQIDVGNHAFAVARERLAHPAEAGLDLVGDEQHVVALVISRTARR